MFHQLRIHADAGEARQRVDLVQYDAAILREEEIHTGQPLTAQCLICPQSSFPNPVRCLIGDPCRNVQLGGTVDILVVVVVEFRSRLNLANI